MQTSIPIKFVSKGWGFEKWICNSEKYCGKLLYFAKGKRCSFHYHKLKDEVFYVQSGKIKVVWTDDLETAKAAGNDVVHHRGPSGRRVLEKGDNFHVPPGRVHQIIALEDTELFEFSTQHFDEDSYRIIKGD
jgi:quercetin dioxygenase-like cupin family protein